MRNKAIIALTVVALLTTALPVTQGPGLLALAGPAEPAGDYSSLGAAVTFYLDRAQEGTNYGFWFEKTVIRWQEFEPTHTSLSKIDLYIGKNGNPGNLRASVKDQAGNVLWETTVAEGDIAGWGWIEILVAPSISLQPDNSYYIYVWSDADSPSPDHRYFWRGQTDSDYDRGISSVESGWPGYDFAFRTWSMSPPRVKGIIYHADQGAGIWRMNADGSGKTPLTDHGWFAEYSPDNTKIAFGEFYQAGIWVMNADSTDQMQLRESGNAPTWSPDGSKIAYHDGDTAGANRRIWVMNADGTNVHQISAENPGGFPKWSPDGSKIAYHGEVNNGIWLMNPDGTDHVQLYAGGGYPTWSPDGKQIAYVSLADWCIWIMNSDGTGKTKLTDHKGIHPDWCPNGTQIAYEDLEKNKGIWVINADGTNDHLINEEGHAPDWSSIPPLEKPDLVVDDIWLNEDNIICFRYRNIGTADVIQTFWIEIYVDGVMVSRSSSPWDPTSPLEPGEMVTRTTTEVISETKQVRVVVDVDNDIAELNEGNNERTETLAVTPVPARVYLPLILKNSQ